MALPETIQKYKSLPSSNFINDFLEFLRIKDYSIDSYLELLDLFYIYEDHIYRNRIIFLNAVKEISDKRLNHSLLFLLFRSKLESKNYESQLRTEFGNYLDSNFPYLTLFSNYKILNHFENIRFRKEGIFYIIKWFSLFSKGYENLYCEDCDAILIPTFASVDNYICSNKDCSNKSVKYENHCWNCNAEINSKFQYKCASCGWYICGNCGSCLQGHSGGCTTQKILAQEKKLELTDFNQPFDESSIFNKIYKANLSKMKSDLLRYRFGINLNRGTKVLNSQDELIYYMGRFGEMHYIKLTSAFSKVQFQKYQEKKINIYDWGCGQGIASIAFIDYCKQNNIRLNIDKVTLIDPSTSATNMAIHYLSNPSYNKNCNFTIDIINEKLDSNKLKVIPQNDTLNIHLFSNILDIKSFDLNVFAAFFVATFANSNLVFTISPKYRDSEKRFSDFYNYLKNKYNTELIVAETKYLRSKIYSVDHDKRFQRTVTNNCMVYKLS